VGPPTPTPEALSVTETGTGSMLKSAPRARKVAFALCHEKRERKDALQRGIGLRVTKRRAGYRVDVRACLPSILAGFAALMSRF
jgi:hypothetical protein